MNQAVLHICLEGAPEPLPWKTDFTAHNLTLVKVASLREAEFSIRAYNVILALVEADAATVEGVAQLAAAAGNGSAPFPLIGVCTGELPTTRRAELLEAGLKQCLHRSDPPGAMQYLLDVLVRMRDLARFEETRFDVGELARVTREQIHDLSQPLSALQGRLQLLSAKAGANDPNVQLYKDLVGLVLDVSRHLMELQQIHRKFS